MADERLGDTETVTLPDGEQAVYSSRARTLLDAVYDWSRFNGIPRGYEWIRRELKAKRVSAAELVRCTLRYGDTGTIRRMGALLEGEGVDAAQLRKLERALQADEQHDSVDSRAAQTRDTQPPLGRGDERRRLTGMNNFHEQAEMFRDALALTRQRTGFAERLIEKDYFCTVLLEYLASASDELVFKGGTCLAKVHGDFYRLSEDLDFVIPIGCGCAAVATEQEGLAVEGSPGRAAGAPPVSPADQTPGGSEQLDPIQRRDRLHIAGFRPRGHDQGRDWPARTAAAGGVEWSGADPPAGSCVSQRVARTTGLALHFEA